MLTLFIPKSERFDERTQQFVDDGWTVEMEHSLVSLSKWESFFKKPFLSNEDKTSEETLWYIKAMVISPDIPDEAFLHMTQTNVDAINAYVSDDMTATTIAEMPGQKQNTEKITNELIYYWMSVLGVPKDCERWHLNRLLTFIKVCNAKNTPPKKMPKNEALRRQRELNAQRRAQLGTSG